MPPFTCHLFVCCNRREPGHPRGCCDPEGTKTLRSAMKAEFKRQGLGAAFRCNESGCLDQCEYGPNLVIYPQGIWYGRVQESDVPRIVAETVSRVCQCSARLSDAIGRVGPNEFAIIAPGTTEEGAARIVARLRDSFDSLRIAEPERRLRFSASVSGVTNLAAASVDTMELLYRATTSLRQTRGYSSPAGDAAVRQS